MQLDMFGTASLTTASENLAPVVNSIGGWCSPNALVFNAALKRKSWRDVATTLNQLSVKAAAEVLLSSGFALGSTNNRATMMAGVQADLLVAVQWGMTGFELRDSRELTRSGPEISALANLTAEVATLRDNQISIAATETIEPVIVTGAYLHTPMTEARVLFRSVSPEEWRNIQDSKLVTGGLNTFNPFDLRREVFFGSALNVLLIRQGEDITRRVEYQLQNSDIGNEYREAVHTLRSIEIDMNIRISKLGYETLQDTPPFLFNTDQHLKELKAEKKSVLDKVELLKIDFREQASVLSLELKAGDLARGFSSVVLETKSLLLEDGKIYSNKVGNSGMGDDIEYGFSSGAVKLTDIVKIHRIMKGEIISVETINAVEIQLTDGNEFDQLETLQIRLDQADPFTQPFYDALDAVTDFVTKATLEKVSIGEMPVFQSKKGLSASITHSAKNPGMFQVTRYAQSGMIGDSQYSSIADAITSEGLLHYKLLSKIDARTLITTVVEAETVYQESRAMTSDSQTVVDFAITAQGAIDAFNADNSNQAVVIMGKLRLDALKEVGVAVGFRPHLHENATGFRNRIGSVAAQLTKSSRVRAARETALFDKTASLARDYSRSKDHSDRAISNGVTDPNSTAFKTFADGVEMTIAQRLPMLVAQMQSFKTEPDYLKISEMVRKAHPAIFDIMDTLEKSLPAVLSLTPSVTPVDHNIGISWNSIAGKKTVVAMFKAGNPDYNMDALYDVKATNGWEWRVYGKDIEKTRQRDEYAASPKGQIETAEKEARYKSEQARALQSQAVIKEKFDAIESRIDSFTNAGEYTAIQKGKIKATLMVMSSGDNILMSRAEWVEKWVGDGEKIGSREENKIQEMSRRAYNRADNREQAVHEKKIKEAGTKTVYTIGNYLVTKSEFDYAQSLLDRKITGPVLDVGMPDIEDHEAIRVVTEGRFIGKIIEIEAGVASQTVNREGSIVHHDVSKLSATVKQGDVISVKYYSGIGNVSGKDISVGVER